MIGTWRLPPFGPLVKAAMRAVPWPTVGGTTGIAVLLGTVAFAVGPAAARPLLMVSFALLAAAGSFTLDEPADVVTDVTPTSRRAQTMARAPALVVPLAGGLAVVAATAARSSDLPTTGVLVALVGNILLGFAVASVLRRRSGEPGLRASTVTVLFLVIGPSLPALNRVVHTFPEPSASSVDQHSNVLWAALAGLSIVALQLSTSHKGIRRLSPLEPFVATDRS
jgi:hypothetical protein